MTNPELEFEYDIGSTFSDVRTALTQLLADMRSSGIDAEDLGTIELVLAEALTNVVEHAYRETAGHQFALNWRLCGTDVCFCVLDTGVAMPGLALPEGKLPSVDQPLEDLPEGGFGWHLIHLLTEDLAYERSGDRNETRFIIPLSTPVSDALPARD